MDSTLCIWVTSDSLFTTMLPPLNDKNLPCLGGVGNEMGTLPSFILLPFSPHLYLPFPSLLSPFPSFLLSPFPSSLKHPLECLLCVSHCAAWTWGFRDESEPISLLEGTLVKPSKPSTSVSKTWDRLTGE